MLLQVVSWLPWAPHPPAPAPTALLLMPHTFGEGQGSLCGNRTERSIGGAGVEGGFKGLGLHSWRLENYLGDSSS